MDYKNINIRNRRATYDYEILETWTAGVVLTGTEIKSLRLGKASLVEGYCYVHAGEVWLKGLNISEYEWGTYNNHYPRRERKLLLQKKEIEKIAQALQDKGLTVVAMRVFINERGLAKVMIGLGRGRKNYDKREYIREKDARREMARVKK